MRGPSKEADGPEIALDAVGLEGLDVPSEANHQSAALDTQNSQPQHHSSQQQLHQQTQQALPQQPLPHPPPQQSQQQLPWQPHQHMQQPPAQQSPAETGRPGSGKENAQNLPSPMGEADLPAAAPMKEPPRDMGGYQKRRQKQAVASGQKMPALCEVQQAGHQPLAALPAGPPMQVHIF